METKTDDLLGRRDKLLGPAYRLNYDDPVHPVRGEGVWLHDAAGRKYLDIYNTLPRGGALARSGAIDPDQNILKLRA